MTRFQVRLLCVIAVVTGVWSARPALAQTSGTPFYAGSTPTNRLPLEGDATGRFVRHGDSLLVLVNSAVLKARTVGDGTFLDGLRIGLAQPGDGNSFAFRFPSELVPLRVYLAPGDSLALDTMAFALHVPRGDLAPYWLVVAVYDGRGRMRALLQSSKDVFVRRP